MSTVRCIECGDEVPESETYHREGGLVCATCFNAAEVEAGFLNGYKSAGAGGMGLALLSICFNPLYIVSFLAISASIATLRFGRGLDPEEQKLIDEHPWPKFVAVVALIVALLALALHLLGDTVRFAKWMG